MATEIGTAFLREGLNSHEDLLKDEAFQVTIRTIREQKGVQRVYWGQQTGDPGIIRVFVDWDSVEDHEDFKKTEQYPSFIDRLGQVIDLTRLEFYHANVTPHPPLILSKRVSPVTEILTVYFSADYPDTDQAKFVGDMKKLFDVAEKQEICTGSAGGWILEDVTIPGQTEKGKGYQAFIGWLSIEAFQAFQQTSTFENAVAPIKRARDVKGMTLVFYTGEVEDKIV